MLSETIARASLLGEARVGYGPARVAASSTSPWRWPEASVSETALQHLMHTRTYVPMLGRFTSPDIKRSFSLFRPGDMNRYMYANANPGRYTDPTGMITCEKTECKEHVEVTPEDEEEAGPEVNWTTAWTSGCGTSRRKARRAAESGHFLAAPETYRGAPPPRPQDHSQDDRRDGLRAPQGEPLPAS